MPEYEHLKLIKLPQQMERRKPPAPVKPPERDHRVHGTKLISQLQSAVFVQTNRRRSANIDPSLVLKIKMTGLLQEEDWERIGLPVVASEPDKTLVVFSASDDLNQFISRVNEYSNGRPPDQVEARYNSFIGGIEEISPIDPDDKIGPHMVAQGIVNTRSISSISEYVVDFELWDMGDRLIRESRLDKIERLVHAEGGEIFDRYIGPSITLARVKVNGGLLLTILSLEDVAGVDFPPKPDLITQDALDISLENLPVLADLDPDAPIIGVIDSGINSHPFLTAAIVGSIGAPASLGTADEWGHGTRVAGVAVFGDMRGQLGEGLLEPGAKICSAKVINASGNFDDKTLVPNQMREAIGRLRSDFGCRIFVIALADTKSVYRGKKLGAWSATLDGLARDLDVLIVVAAGNRNPRFGGVVEEAVTQYPAYLLEEENRFYEPAGAINVLTVGAIAHGEGIGPDSTENLYMRPITLESQPSPFTRIGPGVGGAIKPDLIDVGGTYIFDAFTARLQSGETVPEAGVLTTHHLFLDRLITSGSGTSYSAPRVGFIAAQLLKKFPDASANLLRALLVSSAEVPIPTQELLSSMDAQAIKNVCGYGQPNINKAASSESSRVVFYAEESLQLDHFAVFSIPIPKIFHERGERYLKVTLAFDPPVRNTRVDYAGYGMAYKVFKGCPPEKLVEHFRKRTKGEPKAPDISKFECDLSPKKTWREKSSVQSSSIVFKNKNANDVGEYFLVVQSNAGWSKLSGAQRYALVVELGRRESVDLYEKVLELIRIRVQA